MQGRVGYGYLGAQRSVPGRDVHFGVEVLAVDAEIRVLLYMYFKIEIAGPAGGALTKIEDGYGRNINVSYDGFGRVTSVGNSAGRSASFAYTDGRLTAVTDIDGSQTTYSYDGQGRLSRRKQQVNTLPPAICQGHRIAGIYILTKGTQRGIIIMNEAI